MACRFFVLAAYGRVARPLGDRCRVANSQELMLHPFSAVFTLHWKWQRTLGLILSNTAVLRWLSYGGLHFCIIALFCLSLHLEIG